MDIKNNSTKRKLLTWLPDVIMIILTVALLAWIGDIATWKGSPNKAEWLLIPLTGLYVITSLYIAAANLRSAKATENSVLAMQKTVNLMQLQTNAMYNPVIVMPEGFKCWLKVNGTMEVILANLHNQPALDFVVDLWEMEDSSNGRVCKTSSLRTYGPATFAGDVNKETFVLKASPLSDKEKAQRSEICLKRFQEVFSKEPVNTLCAINFNTKSANWNLLVFDLEIIHPT